MREPRVGVEFVPYRRMQKYHNAKCRKKDWMRRRLPKPGVALACPKCGASLALQLRPTE